MKVALSEINAQRLRLRSACVGHSVSSCQPTRCELGQLAVRQPRGIRAFSLIEVMIAIAIFFAASFVILALVSSGLRTARMLRTTRPNAGMLAAELTLTNQLEEGTESGDFGNMYREYTWSKTTSEAGTNGLWQVDFEIYRRGQGHVPDSTMSILIYSPNSKSKRLGVQPP